MLNEESCALETELRAKLRARIYFRFEFGFGKGSESETDDLGSSVGNHCHYRLQIDGNVGIIFRSIAGRHVVVVHKHGSAISLRMRNEGGHE
jgi:hypothetical protein